MRRLLALALVPTVFAFGSSKPPAGSVASVVLTGGPCSGKTSAIQSLPEELLPAGSTKDGEGWRTVIVPEAATLYHERGGNFPFGMPEDTSGQFSPLQRNLLWEAWLNELKISLENGALALARQSPRPCLLICDRGVCDSRAYMQSDEEWNSMLALAGWSEAEIASRYDAVFHLDVAPREFFNSNGEGDSNEARTETYDEACALGGRTFAAWTSITTRVREACGNLDVVTAPEIVSINDNELSPLADANTAAVGDGAAMFDAKLDCLYGAMREWLAEQDPHATVEPPHTRFTLPTEFVVAQANRIATATDLSKVFPESQRALRDAHLIRQGKRRTRIFSGESRPIS